MKERGVGERNGSIAYEGKCGTKRGACFLPADALAAGDVIIWP